MSTLIEKAREAPVRFATRFTPEQQQAIVLLDAKGWRRKDIVAFLAAEGVKTSSGSVSRLLELVSKDAERVKAARASQRVGVSSDAYPGMTDANQLPLGNVSGTPDVELGI